MSKAVIVIPITAILLLLALPSYFMVVNNLGSSTEDIRKTTDTLVDFSVDEVYGAITETVILTVCSVIAIIAGFFGIKLIFR